MLCVTEKSHRALQLLMSGRGRKGRKEERKGEKRLRRRGGGSSLNSRVFSFPSASDFKRNHHQHPTTSRPRPRAPRKLNKPLVPPSLPPFRTTRKCIEFQPTSPSSSPSPFPTPNSRPADLVFPLLRTSAFRKKIFFSKRGRKN